MLIPKPWFRLYTDFAKDPKVQSMSEALQRRLVILFCLQCSQELSTLSDSDLAFAMSISTKELQITKTQFLKKGFISDDWSVCNWKKRQSKSDFSRERTKAYRENIKAKEEEKNSETVTVTSQESHGDVTVTSTTRHCDGTDIDIDSKKKKLKQKKRNPSGDKNRRDQGGALVSVFDFEKFWAAYPNKVGKKTTEKIFNRLKPDANLLAEMLGALEKQKKIKSQKEKLGQFSPNWKNPVTWIRGQCWLDEPCSGSPEELHQVKDRVTLSEQEIKKLGADLTRTKNRINKISSQISSAKGEKKVKLFETLRGFHAEQHSIETILEQHVSIN